MTKQQLAELTAIQELLGPAEPPRDAFEDWWAVERSTPTLSPALPMKEVFRAVYKAGYGRSDRDWRARLLAEADA